jgi:DNA-binding transcriptional LysR family regulator
MLMRPDFNRLRVFFHVHRAGSVSGAASELHVTQSAVSQSLAKLEDELGAQLFVRRHRKLVPTPAAATLYGVMAPFVDALDEGLATIRRAQHELEGVLRIGAPVEFGSHRLPEVFASFRREHPGVSFELMLGHPSEILPRLDEGRLDLAFTDVFEAEGRTSVPAGLEVVEVLEERLVMVASADYEADQLRGGRGLRALEGCSFVSYGPRAPAVQAWFRHHFGKTLSRVSVALAVESVQAVLTAVQAGMGLGVVPAHTAAASVENGSLVIVATRRRALTNRVSMVRALDKVPSRAERTFVRSLGQG